FGEARVEDVEFRIAWEADAVRLALPIAGRVARRVEQDGVTRDGRVRIHAGSTVLAHVHPMWRERFVGVVGIGERDLRLAAAADAELEEVAKRAVAALPAEHGLDRAPVDVVLAGEDRR